MGSLFIIGNGFDTAHGLNTGYRFFRRYLWWCFNGEVFAGDKDKHEEPPTMIECPRLSFLQLNDPSNNLHEGQFDEENRKERAKYLYWLIDNAELRYIKRKDGSFNTIDVSIEWNEFEELLGMFDYPASYNAFLSNDKISRLMESLINQISSSVPSFFSDWIHEDNEEWTQANGIDYSDNSRIEKQKNKLQPYFSQDDALVLTFNYTDTVERFYGIAPENIYHIHGKQASDQIRKEKIKHTPYGDDSCNAPPEIVVGYGKQDPNKMSWVTCDATRQRLLGRDLELKKQVPYIIDKMKASPFYEKFLCESKDAGIDKVYVFGFSFSEVDEPQILEICKVLYRDCNNAKGITWYLPTYGNSTHGSEVRPSNDRAKAAIKKIVSQIDDVMGEPNIICTWL